MQIKNPTKENIEVQIDGVRYAIEAEGSLFEIPESVARYWQTLHGFLILRKDKAETSKTIEEIPEPAVEPEAPVEEVIEEVVEETIETTDPVEEVIEQ